jgi:class 3 adenylate cyclase
MSLPAAVTGIVREIATAKLCVAFVGVGRDGRILEAGGDLESCGFGAARPGATLTDIAPYLEGSLPASADMVTLERVEVGRSRYVDIHLVGGDRHDWVVLIDRTEEATAQQLMQQHRNELVLLRDRLAGQREQELGSRFGADLTDGLLDASEHGRQQRLTAFFASIGNACEIVDSQPPEIAFESIQLYLRTMVRTILDEAGVVETIIGSGIKALFGLLPSPTPAAVHACTAARRMVDEVQHLNAMRVDAGEGELDVGVGVATGEAVVGIVRSKRRRAVSVLGNPVRRAAELARCAGPKEVLVDAATVAEQAAGAEGFETRVVSIDCVDGTTTVHALQGRDR